MVHEFQFYFTAPIQVVGGVYEEHARILREVVAVDPPALKYVRTYPAFFYFPMNICWTRDSWGRVVVVEGMVDNICLDQVQSLDFQDWPDTYPPTTTNQEASNEELYPFWEDREYYCSPMDTRWKRGPDGSVVAVTWGKVWASLNIHDDYDDTPWSLGENGDYPDPTVWEGR